MADGGRIVGRREFLAGSLSVDHTRAHGGGRKLAYSGWRTIVGARVEGADAADEYRRGFELLV